MDKDALLKIECYLRENGITIEDVEEDVLNAMEQELKDRERGLHILDGLLDPTSPAFCELRDRLRK